MAFTTYEFPFTRVYDGDLGFLIKKYIELQDTYDGLVSDIAYVKDFAEHLDERVASAIKDAMDIFTAQVNATLKRYDSRITNTETKVDEFQKILNSFASELYSMRRLILALEQELKTYTDVECNIIYEKCKLLIDEWSKELPPVIDPTDGKTENINVALQHMYDFTIEGITALQLDNLNISAKNFDALDMTAKQFDTKGYKLLTDDGDIYMLSPFTGSVDNIVNVVNSLAQLHMTGITASVLDSKALTAENFDAMNITAFIFDWHNPIINL